MAFGASLLVACSEDTSVDPKPVVDGGGTDSPISETGPLPDGGDGGTDSGFDGGFVVETFDNVIATELCKSLARCCYGNPTPDAGQADGGTFDVAACRTQYGRLGFEGSNIDVPDAGTVVLDQAQADSCITKIKAMSCSLPGAEYEAIAAACFAAYSGKVAVGGACTTSVECQKGLFCKSAGDGGAGTCAAIRAVGDTCGDFTDDPALAAQACSYRRGGQPGNFCRFYDFTPPGAFIDQADWKCEAPLAVGGDCANSFWCDQSTCQNSKCATPDNYFGQSCETFNVP